MNFLFNRFLFQLSLNKLSPICYHRIVKMKFSYQVFKILHNVYYSIINFNNKKLNNMCTVSLQSLYTNEFTISIHLYVEMPPHNRVNLLQTFQLQLSSRFLSVHFLILENYNFFFRIVRIFRIGGKYHYVWTQIFNFISRILPSFFPAISCVFHL